jgi:hypothetical protein
MTQSLVPRAAEAGGAAGSLFDLGAAARKLPFASRAPVTGAGEPTIVLGVYRFADAIGRDAGVPRESTRAIIDAFSGCVGGTAITYCRVTSNSCGASIPTLPESSMAAGCEGPTT